MSEEPNFLFIFPFGAGEVTHGKAHGSFLAMHSEFTPGKVWGIIYGASD